MPDLSDRMINTTGAHIVAPIEAPAQHPPTTPMEPSGTGFTRCPMPAIWTANPDSLRAFYRSGQVPQLRIYSTSLT